jgi:hypothetical protein
LFSVTLRFSLGGFPLGPYAYRDESCQWLFVRFSCITSQKVKVPQVTTVTTSLDPKEDISRKFISAS